MASFQPCTRFDGSSEECCILCTSETPVMSWSHGWIIYCTCSASVPISPSGHLWYCRQKSMHLEMNFFHLKLQYKKKTEGHLRSERLLISSYSFFIFFLVLRCRHLFFQKMKTSKGQKIHRKNFYSKRDVTAQRKKEVKNVSSAYHRVCPSVFLHPPNQKLFHMSGLKVTSANFTLDF